MAFVTHNNYRSGVNSMPIANERPKRIQNRHWRRCAKDGFNSRIKAELSGNVPATVPLYSHNATLQSYYSQGWYAVTHIHVLKAREQAKAQAMAVPNEQ
uniref:Uncharacterized protein n=1 Tax=Shewanella putrefaciens (strain 200) TaxID=399804 RepID=E6XHQ6_SHEP2